MLHLQWLAFFAIAVTFAVVAHYAFWGWVYRERGDSDALLTAIADDGWRLAVAHYKPETPSDRPPVILCHGLSANRLNMSLPGPNSLAGFLRTRGHEVFALDLRGCGDSHRPPPGRGKNDWTFDDFVLHDAPAVVQLALTTSGKSSAIWVGHSMGGLIGLALAELPAGGSLAGVAALGSPTRWQFHRPLLGRVLALSVHLEFLVRIHNRWSARLIAPYLGVVPLPFSDVAVNPQNMDPALYRRVAYNVLADASQKLLSQFASWFTRNAWDLADHTDLRAGLARIHCPVLLMGGTMDVLAPPKAMEEALGELGAPQKALVLFGKARGDKQDYGHGDLIFGRYAPDEVFPELESWLRAR